MAPIRQDDPATSGDDPRVAEIARAEREIAEAEREASENIAEAMRAAAAVAASLTALARRAHDAEQGRGELNEYTTLLQRLASFDVPTLGLREHRERELAVRADHVRAREWVLGALRRDLRRHREELDTMRAQLAACDAELETIASQRTAPRTQRTRSAPRTLPQFGAVGLAPDAARARAATSRHDDDPDDTSLGGEAPAESGPPKRIIPRVRMSAEITFSSPSNFFTGFSENISDGGLFIASEAQVALGTEVELVFTLPDGVEIRGAGVVRWARPPGDDTGGHPGVGVQFLRLSGAAKDAVEAFVARRDPIFYPI